VVHGFFPVVREFSAVSVGAHCSFLCFHLALFRLRLPNGNGVQFIFAFSFGSVLFASTK